MEAPKIVHPVFPHGVKVFCLADHDTIYPVSLPYVATIEGGRRVQNFLFSQCRVEIEGIRYKANTVELKAVARFLDENLNGGATKQLQAYLSHSALIVPIVKPAPVAMAEAA